MIRMASIVLSMLILLSSSGLAYAKHYCGNLEMLSKVTLGEEHLSCGMAMSNSACGDEHLDENHFCCTNKYLKVSTDEQYAKVVFDFNFDIQWVAISTMIFVPLEIDLPSLQEESYKYYRPPPLEFDYQVLFETFLI